ncbi:DUF4334 domain-containing protein [Rhodococcus triatomae]|uniref:GXWXG protein n=1 Tax=Rhodococcus triatomae TaxID=300028 RepID=A0A1G8KAS6_9NOCA|nr:DUF4334 domain-containing protein [Rhodococcus triatomae]QNG18867.1 DUF4334 domain-containing protein [Rhodococcus triatomae]QNG25221.1 DUF4334 domain-containing protein [Rhodococcus triatomae]SDI40449.1 GXWXG protein [Rhodococcus triatomae]
MAVPEEFAELVRSGHRLDSAELDALWARLDVAETGLFTGLWRGGAFDTGHRAAAMLGKSGWYGKRFDALMDVKPLICRDEDGALYSDTTAGRGEASLWMVEFRGEVTATMVYDGMAVFDHFKKVDEDTVMGIMNGKGFALDGGKPFYFWLARD